MLATRATGAAIALALGCTLLACGDDTGTGGAGTSGTTTTTSTKATSVASGTTKATTAANGSSNSGSSATGAMACNIDICTMYGAAVPAVAGQIVDEAAADPEFMDDFAPLVAEGPAAVMAFKTSLANFVSDAYGCTSDAYTGPSMMAAHAGMGITQAEYDAFIGLIAGVLADNGVPADQIMNCFAPPLVDPTFANTIIGQ